MASVAGKKSSFSNWASAPDSRPAKATPNAIRKRSDSAMTREYSDGGLPGCISIVLVRDLGPSIDTLESFSSTGTRTGTGLTEGEPGAEGDSDFASTAIVSLLAASGTVSTDALSSGLEISSCFEVVGGSPFFSVADFPVAASVPFRSEAAR